MTSDETPNERKQRLQGRVERMRGQASERAGAEVVLECRIEVRHLELLQKIAKSKGLSVSALTRTWLLERLAEEESA